MQVLGVSGGRPDRSSEAESRPMWSRLGLGDRARGARRHDHDPTLYALKLVTAVLGQKLADASPQDSQVSATAMGLKYVVEAS